MGGPDAPAPEVGALRSGFAFSETNTYLRSMIAATYVRKPISAFD
jgi:hypothetical protein